MKKKWQEVSINGHKIPVSMPDSGYVTMVYQSDHEMVVVNEHGNMFHFDTQTGTWTHLKGLDGLRAKPLKILLRQLLP
jgi:hypothetical protein